MISSRTTLHRRATPGWQIILGRRLAVCATAAVLLFSCGDDPADEPDATTTSTADTSDPGDTTPDTTDAPDTETGDTGEPGDTAPTDIDAETTEPPIRSLVAAAPLDGLPVDNRVVEPWLSLALSWAVFRATSTTELHRLVIPDGPTTAPIARLGGPSAGLVMWAQLGDGAHHVSVWLGADGDGSALADATVTVSTLDGTFDLTMGAGTHASQVPSPIAWQTFSGVVTGRAGPALLAFEPAAGTRLYVNAPVVRLADGSGGSAVAAAPRRTEGERERALWRRAAEQLSELPPPIDPTLRGGRP